MCDRSFSDSSRGLGIGVLPHIRDALEQARIAAQAEESYKSTHTKTTRDVDKTNFHFGISKCDSCVLSRLTDSEKQMREMSAYIYDALQLTQKNQTYLRATHVDPAIGLEIELSGSAPQSALPLPDNEVETTPSLIIDQLTQKNSDLRRKLSELMLWNKHLEQEREDLYQIVCKLQAEKNG